MGAPWYNPESFVRPFLPMRLYGIPNCNTVKKARAWLAEQGIEMPFHDFKKSGVDAALLQGWMKQTGWEKLLNRQGTTWRQLPDEVKQHTSDEAAALALMLEKPSIIKRPVLEVEGRVHVGFDADTYARLFNR